MSNKYWLETYGCQMNFSESKSMENEFKESGWEKAKNPSEADLVLLNTCSVRQTAENRIWGRLGFFKHLKKNHPFTLGITGCMAERLKHDIHKKIPEVDMVIGNFNKDKLISYLKNHEKNYWNEDLLDGSEYSFKEMHSGENDFKALLPIMHGCNNFCSYCIVPYVRGREISRSPESILAECKKLEERGVKEVTFLGQNVNSYRFTTDNGNIVSFSDLLHIILDEIKGIEWFRFVSSHPKDVPEDLIEIIGNEERVCSHIHLAVQHGSNKILKRMNRKYTRESFMNLVDRMKQRIPDLSLTTDLLIGFPGETLHDVEQTKELMNYVQFSDAFTYHYNPRTGTKACNFDDVVSEEEKHRRLSEIILLQRSISENIKLKRIGNVEKVLVENVSRKKKQELLGRTARNEMVVFPATSSLIGSFVTVKLVALEGNTFKGLQIL